MNELIALPEPAGKWLNPNNNFSLVTQANGITTPYCSRHGAMNRVAAQTDWWRCCSPDCGIGCEWRRFTAKGEHGEP